MVSGGVVCGTTSLFLARRWTQLNTDSFKLNVVEIEVVRSIDQKGIAANYVKASDGALVVLLEKFSELTLKAAEPW